MEGGEEEWGYIDPCESSCPTTRVKGPRGGMGGKAATPAWSGRGSKLVAAHPSPPVPCSRAEHDQTWGRKGGGARPSHDVALGERDRSGGGTGRAMVGSGVSHQPYAPSGPDRTRAPPPIPTRATVAIGEHPSEGFGGRP